jgi:predicted RNase H-like nuclease (RuvC/YqgF family)
LHVGDVWATLLEGNFNKLKVQNLEERLKEKDQTIDELKKEIMILENQIESLEDEIDQAPSEQIGIMGAVNTFMKNDILVNAAAEKIVSILFTKPQSKTA